jgi:DNA topoisomerase IA
MNVFLVSSKGNGNIISNCIGENYTDSDYKIIKVHPAIVNKKEKTKLITLNDLPVFLNSDKTEQLIDVDKDDLDAIKNADNLYIGLEPDKHNQHCAENILRKTGRSNHVNKRIWFDAATPKNIQYSLSVATPNETYKPISVRYELERNVNYLVGMNISVLFSAVSHILGRKIWVSLSKDKLKVFRFIVDYLNNVKKSANKMDRRIFVAIEPRHKAKWLPDEAYLDDMGYMPNHGHQNQVLRLLKNETELTLKQVNQGEVQVEPPPAPLNINSLFALVKEEYPQISYQEAHKALKILYYKGYILNPDTFEEKYHTRHKNAGAAFIKELHQIKHRFASMLSHNPTNEIYSSDLPSYSHGALMPIRGRISHARKLKNLERFIYALIVKYFVAQYCKPYSSKIIEYKFKASKSHEQFIIKKEQVIERGWKGVIETSKCQGSIPKYKQGDSVKVLEVMQETAYPTPLLTFQAVFDHFSNTDLNVWHVLEGLAKSGYISTSENGYIILTDDGTMLSKVLDKVPSYDALLEKIDEYLADCTSEAGIGAAQDAIEHDVNSYISDTFRLLNNEGVKKCPECLTGYLAKITKDKNDFMGCCNFPSCNYTEES